MRILIRFLLLLILIQVPAAYAALDLQIDVLPSVNVEVGELVYFDADSSTYDDVKALEMGRFEWDFGDGYTHEFDYPSLAVINGKSGLSVAHYFMAPGTYTVTLSAKLWQNIDFASSGNPETFSADSSSSMTIGTGSTTMTTDTGLTVSVGGAVKATYVVDGTSSTSMSIADETKTLTTETGKAYGVGGYATIWAASDPDTYLYGTITSYDSDTGELVFNTIRVQGSGTYDSWVVRSYIGNNYSCGEVTSYNSETGQLVFNAVKVGGLGQTRATWQIDFEKAMVASGTETVEITVSGTAPIEGFEIQHAPFSLRSKQYLYIQIPAAHRATTTQLVLKLIDSESNETTLISAHDDLEAEEVYLFDQTVLSAGNYVLQAQLLDAGGSQITGGLWRDKLTKTTSGTPPLAIDENNSFMVNGEHFFPVGPFMVDKSKAWPEPGVIDFAASGNVGAASANIFHTTGYYSTYTSGTWDQYLDFIHAYGMKAKIGRAHV